MIRSLFHLLIHLRHNPKQAFMVFGALLALIAGLSFLEDTTPKNKQSILTQTLRVPASKNNGEWTFKFNTDSFKKNTGTNFKDQEFSLVVKADTWEEAYKKASKECFNKLSGGSYPGEDRGMDIIDICVNPR